VDLNQLLPRLKSRLGKYTTVDDTELVFLLEDAQNEILIDINQITLPTDLTGTLIQWATIKYNRMGTEGMTSEGFSGTSSSYENDFPDYIKRTLNRYRRPGKRNKEVI